MFGPWWWSSSKRIQLLLQRSEFESLWSQQFLNKIVIEKNENKRKENKGVGKTILNVWQEVIEETFTWCIFKTSSSSSSSSSSSMPKRLRQRHFLWRRRLLLGQEWSWPLWCLSSRSYADINSWGQWYKTISNNER